MGLREVCFPRLSLGWRWGWGLFWGFRVFNGKVKSWGGEVDLDVVDLGRFSFGLFLPGAIGADMELRIVC